MSCESHLSVKDQSLSDILQSVASSEPAPGGGSVAALSVAFASSLLEMVSGLTLGREKFAEVETELKAVLDGAKEGEKTALTLFDEDIQAFLKVMEAYGLPKVTEDEKTKRRSSIAKALYDAATVPLDTARTALMIMKHAETAVFKGNPNAVTDSAVAALLSEAALVGAVLNVRINLSSLRKLISKAGSTPETEPDGLLDDLKESVATIQKDIEAMSNEAASIKERVLEKALAVIGN